MKRRYKILLSVVALLAASIGALALYASHDSPCVAPAAAGGDATAPQMQAVVYRCYGSPEVLKLEQVARPVIADDQLLVTVEAASVNPLDWHFMRGKPYIMRFQAGIGAPKSPAMGVDFAGTVVAVGARVTRFKVGDAVFGGADGAFAQYVSIGEGKSVVPKPANVSFQDAAALPIAAITALQSLRDKGGLKPGQSVLVNGASGGVGTYAVQIAKALGAEVTGVCSTRNVELVRSIGADHVIDYKRDNFTQAAQRYDVILDTVGNHSLSALRQVLKPGGAVLMVGGSNDEDFLGPLSGVISGALYSKFVSERFVFVLAQMQAKDLAVLAQMMQDGKLRSVIDRHYPLADAAEAIRYVEEGHARGKVIIDVAALQSAPQAVPQSAPQSVSESQP